MARLARIAFLATLLIAAAALAACGGDTTDKNRYIRELTAAQTRYQTTAKRIGADATRTSSPGQDRRTLDRFATAIVDTIAALRRIDVPPQVVTEHRRFVEVFVTWHDDLARFVDAIKRPTRRGVRRAEHRIAVANQTFNQRLRQAGTDIDAKLRS
jgi:glutamyl-tRNA reductase